MGDPGSISGSERSLGEGSGNPVQYSCLENPNGWSSLVGYSPWGRKELDTTENLHFTHCLYCNNWPILHRTLCIKQVKQFNLAHNNLYRWVVFFFKFISTLIFTNFCFLITFIPYHMFWIVSAFFSHSDLKMSWILLISSLYVLFCCYLFSFCSFIEI